MIFSTWLGIILATIVGAEVRIYLYDRKTVYGRIRFSTVILVRFNQLFTLNLPMKLRSRNIKLYNWLKMINITFK